MPQWKLGFLASLSYAQMLPEDVVASLAGIGYQAVEWTAAHFDPRRTTAAQRRALVQVAANHGLDVSEVGAQQDLVCADEATRRDRIAQGLEAIEAASEAGIQTLNMFTGPASWKADALVVGKDISLGAAWDQVFDAFDQFVPAAERAGVRIAVEGVFGMVCHDLYSTLPLIERYRSPALGVNLDPSHDILAGNTDSDDIVRWWGVDRIHHIHLKDAVGIPHRGLFVFPLLGEGRVPWARFFAALDEIGYKGYCSVEFESFAYSQQILRGDGEAAARLSYEQVQVLLGASG